MAKSSGLAGMSVGRPSGDRTEKQKAMEAVIRKDRPKVVRDSFTMPESDYEKIRTIRTACMKEGVAPTKAQILRAGVRLLAEKSSEELAEIIRNLPEVRPSRF